MGRGQRCLTTIQPFWGICCFECFDPLLHHGRISNQITLGQLPLNGWGSVSPSRRTSSKSPLSTMNKGNCCNSGWFRKRFSGHTQILLALPANDIKDCPDSNPIIWNNNVSKTSSSPKCIHPSQVPKHIKITIADILPILPVDICQLFVTSQRIIPISFKYHLKDMDSTLKQRS